MYKVFSRLQGHLFSTLVLAEHNGQSLSKNSFKLLSAASKFNEDVKQVFKIRLTSLFLETEAKQSLKVSIKKSLRTTPKGFIL